MRVFDSLVMADDMVTLGFSRHSHQPLQEGAEADRRGEGTTDAYHRKASQSRKYTIFSHISLLQVITR